MPVTRTLTFEMSWSAKYVVFKIFQNILIKRFQKKKQYFLLCLLGTNLMDIDALLPRTKKHFGSDSRQFDTDTSVNLPSDEPETT